MKRLKKWLEDENIFLEIKRGDNKIKKSMRYKIKNDELGQIILSTIIQKPGTSRSGKKTIFENNSIYNQIFKQNYDKTIEKRDCIIDLIDLNERYLEIEGGLKNGTDLRAEEKDVLKNGKQIIFALIGVLYSLKNGDLKVEDLLLDTKIIKSIDFVYSKIIGNYSEDDLNETLRSIVIDLVQILYESYTKSYDKGSVTSISNYFKTDKKYIEEILKDFANAYCRLSIGKDLKELSRIFRRN